MENIEFEIEIYTKIKKNKMKYKELANNLGITQAYLSQIIKGKRKAEKYREKIRQILDIRGEK